MPTLMIRRSHPRHANWSRITDYDLWTRQELLKAIKKLPGTGRQESYEQLGVDRGPGYFSARSSIAAPTPRIL